MSMSLTSTLRIPSIIFVKIIGNIVKIPIKIGTEPELNQMSANKIKETTGTERIMIIQGFMNDSNEEFNPAMIPRPMPNNMAMINPMIPLRIVFHIVRRKFLVINKLKTDFSVSDTPGNILFDPIFMEAISHKTNIKPTETMLI